MVLLSLHALNVFPRILGQFSQRMVTDIDALRSSPTAEAVGRILALACPRKSEYSSHSFHARKTTNSDA